MIDTSIARTKVNDTTLVRLDLHVNSRRGQYEVWVGRLINNLYCWKIEGKAATITSGKQAYEAKVQELQVA